MISHAHGVPEGQKAHHIRAMTGPAAGSRPHTRGRRTWAVLSVPSISGEWDDGGFARRAAKGDGPPAPSLFADDRARPCFPRFLHAKVGAQVQLSPPVSSLAAARWVPKFRHTGRLDCAIQRRIRIIHRSPLTHALLYVALLPPRPTLQLMMLPGTLSESGA